jgi:hypothetical protein
MEKDLRRRLGWREAIIPRRRPVEDTAAPERRSTRSFGEYACLEDSRYASQSENVARMVVADFGTALPSVAGRRPARASRDSKSAFTRAHSPSKTGVNALNDARCVAGAPLRAPYSGGR